MDEVTQQRSLRHCFGVYHLTCSLTEPARFLKSHNRILNMGLKHLSAQAATHGLVLFGFVFTSHELNKLLWDKCFMYVASFNLQHNPER